MILKNGVDFTIWGFLIIEMEKYKIVYKQYQMFAT